LGAFLANASVRCFWGRGGGGDNGREPGVVAVAEVEPLTGSVELPRFKFADSLLPRGVGTAARRATLSSDSVLDLRGSTAATSGLPAEVLP
jgi:hypothetical protein